MDASGDQLENTGMGTQLHVKDQDRSLEKHPMTIDRVSGAAEELVAGKVRWQEGDSCKQGESTALKCQALHHRSGKEGGFTAAGIF